MPRYDVTAWCSFPHYTIFEVEAASISEALEKAKAQVADEYPEPCDGASYEWNEFELCSRAADEHLLYLEPERAAEIAAPELLDALRAGLNAARNVTDCWENGDLAQSVRALCLWATETAAAIKRATGIPREAPCA